MTGGDAAQADGVRVVSRAGRLRGAGGHRRGRPSLPGGQGARPGVRARRGRGRPGERDAAAARVASSASSRSCDAPELYVEPDLQRLRLVLPQGRLLNIGIGVHLAAPTASLPRRRDALVAALRASGRLPADLPIEPFKGHAYVVRRQAPRRLAGARLLPDRRRGRPRARPLRRGHRARHPERAAGRRGGRRRCPPGRAARRVRARRSCARYGPGEPGWLGRQLARLPDARGPARWCGSCSAPSATRRRVVFDAIFGMREVAS